MDPLNVFNPGIGGTSMAKYYGSTPPAFKSKGELHAMLIRPWLADPLSHLLAALRL